MALTMVTVMVKSQENSKDVSLDVKRHTSLGVRLASTLDVLTVGLNWRLFILARSTQGK
jgi:hypothetical protein